MKSQTCVRLQACALATATLLATLGTTGCGGVGNFPGDGSLLDRRILAMSIDPPSSPPPTFQDYLNAVALAESAGVRGSFLSFTWSALEPGPESYSLQDLADGVSFLGDQRGMVLLIGVQVINTVRKEAPSDLLALAFNDPVVKARFRSLIDAIRPTLSSHVAYLSIGNEVDVYLGAHPDEWAAYQEFFEDALAYLHQVAPMIRVGVTVTFDGANGPDATNVAQLSASSDVVILTYYPLQAGFEPRSPQAPLSDFPRMLALAGNLPVVLQEVGYPSSSVIMSSEDLQGQYVTNVFQAWQAAGNRMVFLNYFLLHDFPESLCESLASYYNLPNDANFKAFLCSLGLRHADGTPKAAWQAFVSGASGVAR